MPSAGKGKEKEKEAPPKPAAPARHPNKNIVKSGNSHKSSAPPPDPDAPPPLFPPGFKTPLNLLNERCQKHDGWARATVDSRPVAGGFTAVVTLRRTHPKSKENEQVRLVPSELIKDTALEARHFAAVYALHRFENGLNLQLQLPPSTRDYWKALEAERKQSPSHKAWMWAANPFEAAPSRQSNPSSSSGAGPSTSSRQPTSGRSTPAGGGGGVAAPKVLPKVWQEAPEVKMSPALRTLVENVIRDSTADSEDPSMFDDGMEMDEAPYDAAQVQAMDSLQAQGFRKGHVKAAIDTIARTAKREARPSKVAPDVLRKQALEHLLVHVPEEDLPPSFATSRPADAGARLATSNTPAELALTWRAEQLARDVGCPIPVAQKCLQAASGDTQLALVELLRMMGAPSGLAGAGTDDLSQWEERQADELGVLEGTFGDAFSRVQGTNAGDPEQAQLDVDGHEGVSLRLLLSQTASPLAYPSPGALPICYVHAPSQPAYIKLHLTYLLVQELSAPSRTDLRDLIAAGGGGVVSELFYVLQDRVQTVLDDPPNPREVGKMFEAGSATATPLSSRPSTPLGTKRRAGGPQRSRASPAENARLLQYLEQVRNDRGYQQLEKTRKTLPAWAQKDKLVQMVESSRVVVIAGETGSGKTTQLPSFVLEAALAQGKGSTTNIIVTQPRRVSAIGVATRVAQEWGESIDDPARRKLVGYAIRGERKADRDCRLLFCTTGVVLRRLAGGKDSGLAGCSHIFIDEVHERSLDSDFLLMELRGLLKRNKTIKVILMSATINQQQFADYFSTESMMEIPGRTFPVEDFYIEDYIASLQGYLPSPRPLRKANQAQLDHMRAHFYERGVTDPRLLSAMETLTRDDRVDYPLVGAVTRFCLEQSKPGEGILVFMSGVAEIRQAIEAIKSSCGGFKVEIFPLHANLTNQEQSAVFRKAKPGHHKIVVSTNVAETSITIDDIVYVLDSGRVKENQFDPDTGVVRLAETYTSKAASRQRRGRAGRTQPGRCYKLFSHYTEHTAMANSPTPEMARTPLEMLCLQIKKLHIDVDVQEYLSLAVTPPDVKAVDAALRKLLEVGALEPVGGASARLTSMGDALALLPMDLRLGKMLIYSAIFGCLEPILSVVAILSCKPLFLNPPDQRDEATRIHRNFYERHSDLLSLAALFDTLNTLRRKSRSELSEFCRDNFISVTSVFDIASQRTDYLSALVEIGFLPHKTTADDPALNRHSQNENLLRAIIYSGNGNLLKVKLPPALYDQSITGAIERERLSKEVKFFDNSERVFLHPSSLLFDENRYATPFATYFKKSVTSKPFILDVTQVPLYGVLLFGGSHVQVEHDRGVAVQLDIASEVPEFIKAKPLNPITNAKGNEIDPALFTRITMRSWTRIGVLVNQLRRLLDAALKRRLDEPSAAGDERTIEAILALLIRDGF